jgi:DNA (cytosine-5)-methyltransferase 1
LVGFQSTLGDLFCGVGGFSEGFRQAGFRTIWAVDNWRPAVESFVHNSPGTKVVEEDILNLDLSTLEPVQVLVGSPPCTNFSFANKGGNGDIDSGLRLVKKFIDAIDVLKPRYYIMENIPRLLRVLQDRMKKRALDNYFPQRVLLNASDFGVAQNRRRLFCGRFPLPNPTTCNSKVPLGKMIFGLPSPVGTGSAPVTVRDPVYGFRMPISKLTDHFMDTTIDKASAGRFIRMRRSHPWCGKMRFPDSLNIPSRTIDTIASSPRQSVVISDPRHGQGTYRTLTCVRTRVPYYLSILGMRHP